MKRILLFLALMCSVVLTAQTFDSELQRICKIMGDRLNEMPNMQLAVYPFIDNDNRVTDLGNIVTDEFWGNLVNEGKSFQVMERSQLDYYLDEHELERNGLINPETAKQFGMLIQADAYVTGKVFVFTSYLRLKVKVVDTETSQILAAGSGKLPLDYDMAEYLEIENWRSKKEEAGLNKSTNPKCDEQNVGDFCFENNTPLTYEISAVLNKNQNSNIVDLSMREIKLTVAPWETNCYRDLPIATYKASMIQRPATVTTTILRTNFYIEECVTGRHTLGSKESVTNRYSNSKREKSYYNGPVGGICITNGNLYARNVILSNQKNGIRKSVQIGQAEYRNKNKSCTYDLPIGVYNVEVFTTYSGVLIEKSQVRIFRDQNQTINLTVNHKN